MKKKMVEVFEEWRKGWATPDVYVYRGKGKKKERFYLRYHTSGELPFVKFKRV